MRRLLSWALLLSLPYQVWAITPNVTGYEIAVDPALVQAIKPLKPKFLKNLGKPLTRKLLLEDVKRFQLLGTVGMVRTGQEDYKNGKKLLYKIEANPPIRSLALTGVTQFEPAELLKGFKSKEGQLLDYTRLYSDVNTIPDAYLNQKGIMYADVTDHKDVTVKDGHVSIHVREFKLADLVIEGATEALEKNIRRTFKLASGDPIHRDALLGSLCNIYPLEDIKDLDWFPKFDREKCTVSIVLAVTPAKPQSKGRRSAD
jgi:hypothetical protein